MSLFRLLGGELFFTYRQGLHSLGKRSLVLSSIRASEQQNPSEEGEETKAVDSADDHLSRTRVIPVETSIRYLASEAYQQSYQGEPVWKHYRRNHKGAIPPRKTRKTCIRAGRISTGNPCPICRDEYLVLDHQNVDLIKQFISPQSGKVLSYQITGLCQKKHLQLLVAVERAIDHGLLTFDVPFREYDYSEYYPNLKQ